MVLALRNYQVEAIDIVSQNIINGEKRQLVSLPTGAGKTVVFSSFIENCFNNLGMQRALILAHRDELINQAIIKIKQQLPGIEVGVVKAGKNEIDAQIVVSSIQTLGRKRRLEMFAQDAFDVIIVDEAHHAYAPAYLRIISYFGGFQVTSPTKVVGFTATAQRPGLDRIFNLSYHKDIREMIQKGYLAPINSIEVKTKAAIYGLGLIGGDFNINELNSRINTPERNAMVVEGYIKHALGEKAIAFTTTVSHAKNLAVTFEQMGVEAAYLWAGTPPRERQKILRKQQRGDIKVICNCGILTEGYDDPSISTILMARPTLSNTLYIQMIGRGLRTHDDKEECKVIDFVDNADRHDLITLPFLMPDFKTTNKSRGKSGSTVVLSTDDEDSQDIIDDEEIIELAEDSMETTETDVDLFTVKAVVEWAINNNGDLVCVPNNKVTIRVVHNNGWYNINIDRKARKSVMTTQLNKKPFLTQDDAKFMAEVYITKAGLTANEKHRREHRDNPNCKALVWYADTVVPKSVLTPKEAELFEIFMDPKQGDLQINKTARYLGCTHTNVWIRLYGPKVGEVGGILKKMQDAYEKSI